MRGGVIWGVGGGVIWGVGGGVIWGVGEDSAQEVAERILG